MEISIEKAFILQTERADNRSAVLSEERQDGRYRNRSIRRQTEPSTYRQNDKQNDRQFGISTDRKNDYPFKRLVKQPAVQITDQTIKISIRSEEHTSELQS